MMEIDSIIDDLDKINGEINTAIGMAMAAQNYSLVDHLINIGRYLDRIINLER